MFLISFFWLPRAITSRFTHQNYAFNHRRLRLPFYRLSGGTYCSILFINVVFFVNFLYINHEVLHTWLQCLYKRAIRVCRAAASGFYDSVHSHIEGRDAHTYTRARTQTHTYALEHALFRLGAHNGLDLTITSACVGASDVATGFSTRLSQIRGKGE